MSLASPGRQLSVHPLDILNGQGNGTLCGGGVEDWISHSLLFTSSTLSGSNPHAQLFPSFLQRESTSGGSSFPAVSWLMETCHWSFVLELSRHPNLVQDGDQPVGLPSDTKGQLDGLHRFEGCLPSNPGTSQLSPVSPFCGTQSVPVQSALHWSFHGSSGLHLGHGSGFCYASSSWGTDAPLPRRLVAPRIISDQCHVGEGHGTCLLLWPRDSGQPG